jgi:hypothetical protein
MHGNNKEMGYPISQRLIVLINKIIDKNKIQANDERIY